MTLHLPPRNGYGRNYSIAALLAGLCWLLAMTSLPAAGQAQASSEALDPASGTSGHALILCTDGSITGWGSNGAGELGSYTSSYASTPVIVSAGLTSSVVKVAVVNQSSFAIMADGSLWAWGDNTYGQLGVGSSTAATSTAMQVPGIGHVIAVAGGFEHTVALCADGTVWSWGERSFGALGTSSGAAIEYLPQQIPSLTNIRAITSGDQFSMALDASGHIWSWGHGTYGELGIGQPAGSPPQATPVQIQLDNVRQIDAANVRAAALCSDGTVWNWGLNSNYQLGLNTTSYTNTPAQVGAGIITDAVWVAMNTGATIAARPDGSTYVWGYNEYGDLGIPSPAAATLPVAGPSFSPNVQVFGQGFLFISIEHTGTVKTWGGYPLGYTPVNPTQYGGSSTPTTPNGVCLAVPVADFPECGPLRAYYMRPNATYEAARHGYTVSPAEVGTFGQLTTIDASLPPYNGTVVFDGIYHLRGDVRFINGSFETQPGTVFYINGLSGRTTDSQLTSIEADNSTLTLTSTEMKAQCDEFWLGIALTNGTQLRTYGTGKLQRVHSVIRDARNGVYNYAGHYYLYATDFINNNVGVVDLTRANVLAGEGVQNCRFVTDPAAGGPLVSTGNLYGSYGIYFSETTEAISQNYYGDFGNAIFANNVFERLRVGIGGTAGNATILFNSFTNCWQAAAYSEGRPNSPEAVIANKPTLPMVFRSNSFALPSNLPAGYLATFLPPQPGYTTNALVYGTTYGLNGQAGYEVRNNTFTLAPAGPGVASRHVGVSLLYQGTAFNNTFTALAVGLEARSGEWYMATNYDIEKNTFADNTEGVSFLPPTYYNGPPTMSVTLRCNTFRSTVAGATGVWVKTNTLFPSNLGDPNTPNGNRFDGIANVKKRFVYEGSGTFTYHQYNSPQENVGQSSQLYDYTEGTATGIVSNSQVPATNACGGNSLPGVQARSVAATSGALPTGGLAVNKVQLGEAYPNPASETLFFPYFLPDDSPPALLVLRNAMGQRVAAQPLPRPGTGEARFQVSSLPPGLYVGTVEMAGQVLVSHKLTLVR